MDYPLRIADQLRAHLRALRKQRGLTQAQLGQMLGIGQVRVAEIEAKPGSVSADQLIKLLSVLGATLVLRDRPGSPKAIESVSSKDKPRATRRTKSTVLVAHKSSKVSATSKKDTKPPAREDKQARPAQGLVLHAKKGSW